MGDGSRQKGFTSSWGTIHEHTLGLGNTEGLEDFGMFDGEFDDFLHLLDLLVKSSNHVVGGVWNFFYLHEGDERVNLGGEDLVEDVVVGTDCNSQVWLDVLDLDGLVQVDNVLAFMAKLRNKTVTLTSTRFFPITFTTSPT
jgi:hypothetical protein